MKIANHLIKVEFPKATLLAYDNSKKSFTAGDGQMLRGEGQRILIVDDGINTGNTLNTLLDLCTGKKGQSPIFENIRMLFFIDRLTTDFRNSLARQIPKENIKSVYQIPIPTFGDNAERCPLCNEITQLEKYAQLMSIAAKGYIEKRLKRIKAKEIASDIISAGEVGRGADDKSISRAKMLDLLYGEGDTAFLSGFASTPIEELINVLDAIPPEYIRMKDTKERLLKESKKLTGDGLRRFLRMWMNVDPSVIAKNLGDIILRIIDSNSDCFIEYIIEFLLCDGYLEKDYARGILERAIQSSPMHSDSLKKTIASVVYKYPDMISLRHSLQAIYDKLVQKAARKDVNILLTGESGTGKGILAKIIHELSDRSSKPFKTVNVSQFTESLLESELFGHEKGAFTGASNMKKGKLEVADGGTVFLDEVGDIPLHLQKKILRAIDQKEFERVGGTEEIKTDFRLICATNRPLEEMVRKEEFRGDLYHRINVVRIELPPLRDTPSEIMTLSKHFFNFFCEKHGIQDLKYDKALDKLLLAHNWPGNVRELKNLIEECVVLSDNVKVDLDVVKRKLKRYLKDDHDNTHVSIKEAKAEAEKRKIENALNEFNLNITKAASSCKTSRNNFYRLIKKYKINIKKGLNL
jgi:DNA-binding NtrC family response regulator